MKQDGVSSIKGGNQVNEAEVIAAMKAAGIDKQKKKQKVPTYNMTDQQLEDMKTEVRKESIKLSFAMFILFSYMYLRDVEHYGTKRMERFVEYIDHMQDLYDQGQFKLYDLNKTMKEETGMSVEDDDPKIAKMLMKC